MPSDKIKLPRVKRALRAAEGNVVAAAKALSVPTSDLRRMVRRDPDLIDDAIERAERALDEAEGAIRAALKSEDKGRRLKAAAIFLRMTEAGQRRLHGP